MNPSTIKNKKLDGDKEYESSEDKDQTSSEEEAKQEEGEDVSTDSKSLIKDLDCTPMYSCLHTNTSRHLMTYSDMLMPIEYCDYPSQKQVHEYLSDYCKKFELEKYICFNTYVENILLVPATEDASEKWVVTYRDVYVNQDDSTVESNTKKEIFDAVVVANGHFKEPSIPEHINKMKDVYKKGVFMHSKEFKHPDQFKDKVVVGVGVGSSGADIISVITRHNKETYISVKENAMVVPKYVFGMPVDQVMKRRIFSMVPTFIKQMCQYIMMLRNIPRKRGAFKRLNSKLELANATNGLSTELIQMVGNGEVKVLGTIESCTENEITFSDGTKLSPDVILCCTGYKYSIPFLNRSKEDGSSVLNNEGFRVGPIYKEVFHVEYPSIGFVGLNFRVEPLLTSELQCRWIAKIWSGKGNLPSKQKMIEWNEKKEKNMKKSGIQMRFWHRANYVSYCEDIAKEIGCKPNVLKYRNSEVLFDVVFGPLYPVTYRIDGLYSLPFETIKQMLEQLKTT